MSGSLPRVPKERWIEEARRALVEAGPEAVKVDRLGKRLDVTRGSFYHHFRDRADLLTHLLQDWLETCRFLPTGPIPTARAEAWRWYHTFVDRLLREDGYDHRYDMAVREWGRSNDGAARAVEHSDRERIDALRAFFRIAGYDDAHAFHRARVFYFHQIGYYAIGVQEPLDERLRTAAIYEEILCGPEVMAQARNALKNASTG